MQKDVFNSTVSAVAKNGFNLAGKALYRQDRKITQVFNQIGEKLAQDVAALEAAHGEIPEGIELVVELRVKP